MNNTTTENNTTVIDLDVFLVPALPVCFNGRTEGAPGFMLEWEARTYAAHRAELVRFGISPSSLGVTEQSLWFQAWLTCVYEALTVPVPGKLGQIFAAGEEVRHLYRLAISLPEEFLAGRKEGDIVATTMSNEDDKPVILRWHFKQRSYGHYSRYRFEEAIARLTKRAHAFRKRCGKRVTRMIGADKAPDKLN